MWQNFCMFTGKVKKPYSEDPRNFAQVLSFLKLRFSHVKWLDSLLLPTYKFVLCRVCCWRSCRSSCRSILCWQNFSHKYLATVILSDKLFISLKWEYETALSFRFYSIYITCIFQFRPVTRGSMPHLVGARDIYRYTYTYTYMIY